jgi:HPt (histidine-containing phosphotransfer) domain-containing protein
MINPNSNSVFTFSEKIDADYMFNMYEDDYSYIETMFKTVLDHFDADRLSVLTNFQQSDIELLRKAVHKIKPTFGFVGMPDVLEKCKAFENKCYQVQSLKDLEEDYKDLLNTLEDAHQVIINEHNRLVSFNRSAA